MAPKLIKFNFPPKSLLLPGGMAEAGIGARLNGVILELVRQPEHVVVEDDGLIKVPLVVMRGTWTSSKKNSLKKK